MCRAEVAEYGEVSLPAQILLELGSHFNTASHYHHVDVVGRAFEE